MSGSINRVTSVIVMLSDASSPTVQVEDTGGGSVSKETRSLGVHTSTLEGNISSGSSARAHKQQLCKYFLSKRGCPFGERCRYLHAELGDDPEGEGRRQVCRHFLSSGTCRYGNKCKYLHPTPSHKQVIKPHPTEPQATHPPPPDMSSTVHPPPLLDVSSFPSMKGKHVPHVRCEYLVYVIAVQSKTSAFSSLSPSLHTHTAGPSTHPPPPSTTHKQHKHGPPELSLDAFFQTSKIMQPRPPVSRPPPRKANTTSELRQVKELFVLSIILS